MATLRSGHDHSFVDVPVLVHDVLPVDEPSALRILDAGAPHLSGPERELVLRQAQGNPLALVELPKAWRAPMPPGRTAAFLPSAMPITERLQRAFAGRMVDLPQASRDLLPIAAADDSGDTGEIIAAASELAGHPVTTEAADVAVRSGLVTYDGPRLRFQHLRDLAADVRVLCLQRGDAAADLCVVLLQEAQALGLRLFLRVSRAYRCMRAIGMPVSRRQRRVPSQATSSSVKARRPFAVRPMWASNPMRS